MVIDTINKRDVSIDILKFFAVILITNSHMAHLYVKFSALATGGAIGDVFFFFCSGFTLFLSKQRRFDNYYKRRINRIYPTVFMWALLASVLFNNKDNMQEIIIWGGGWFVTCIMIYYVVLYFIRRFVFDNLKAVFVLLLILSFVAYYFWDNSSHCLIYGNTYLKWGLYFHYMLLGAMVGCGKVKVISFSLKKDLICCVLSLIAFYGILWAGTKNEFFFSLQIVTLLPLFGITFYSYKLCNSATVKKLIENKYTAPVVKIVSGLCLEIYVVQYWVMTDKLNSLFPMNIPIVFVLITCFAYLLRCMSRWFSQTFKDADYDWKAIFKVY